MLCASMATLLLIDITTTATAAITAQPQLKCGTGSCSLSLSFAPSPASHFAARISHPQAPRHAYACWLIKSTTTTTTITKSTFECQSVPECPVPLRPHIHPTPTCCLHSLSWYFLLLLLLLLSLFALSLCLLRLSFSSFRLPRIFITYESARAPALTMPHCVLINITRVRSRYLSTPTAVALLPAHSSLLTAQIALRKLRRVGGRRCTDAGINYSWQFTIATPENY